MRHKKKFNHLSRTASHRKAMLSNMASSLILHKRINTTVAKAKALRVYVEPLITKSKNDTTHSRRTVFAQLQDKQAVTELFREVSQKVADRPGGYTRIIKTGNRLGDNAEMCMIELVDYNELLLNTEKKKTRRSRRGGGKKSETTVAAPAAPAKEVEVKEEATEATATTEEVVVEEPAKEAEAKTEATAEVKEEVAPVAEEAPVEEVPAEEVAEPEAKVEEPKSEADVEETAEAKIEEAPEAKAEEAAEEKTEDKNEEGEEGKKSE